MTHLEVRACWTAATASAPIPRNTNYAGGNTSAKGEVTDPVTGRARRTVVGQGIRRRPRHAHRGRPRRAAARPPAQPGRRSTRASTARTRWSRRSTTACSAAAAPPRRSTPRCTAWSTRRTSTTCTRTPASRSRPPPTARRSRERSSATGWCGCRGGGPASSSGSTSPPSGGSNPDAIGVILGGHGITAWGATSEECEANSLEIIRDRRAVHRRARASRSRSARWRCTSVVRRGQT